MPVLPALGGKLNRTMADLALGARRAAQRDQLGDAGGQRRRPARACDCMSRGLLARRRLPPSGRRTPSSPVAPSSSGSATIMVASTGSRPRSEPSHWSSVWNSTGVHGEVGHVQPGQHLLGGLGVVVGRAADQREAGERDHGVDHRPAAREEELLDRRAASRGRWRRPGSRAGRAPPGRRSRRHSARCCRPAGRSASAAGRPCRCAPRPGQRARRARRCGPSGADGRRRPPGTRPAGSPWRRRAAPGAGRRRSGRPGSGPCRRRCRREPASQYCSVRK